MAVVLMVVVMGMGIEDEGDGGDDAVVVMMSQ